MNSKLIIGVIRKVTCYKWTSPIQMRFLHVQTAPQHLQGLCGIFNCTKNPKRRNYKTESIENTYNCFLVVIPLDDKLTI